MIPAHVHISKGVSKLGANIPSVSLPAGITCRPDAPCHAKCYARKGRFVFRKTKSLFDRNLEIWHADPVQYERDVIIAAFSCRYFRWHVSGDIPDMNYLEMMVRVAVGLPETKFLCFTKKFELVNAWRTLNPDGFPANIKIVLSAWGEFVPDNPFNLPQAFVRLKHAESRIPVHARQCGKFCGECVMTNQNCWSLSLGEAVVFDEH